MAFPFFADLPALLGGRLLQAPAAPAAVRHLLLDSRRAGPAAGSVFFALRGPQHDGHRYLPELYAKGVRLFVIEESAAPAGGLAAYPGAGIVAVPSPLAALQALAAAHRRQFSLPVLAITGSNGKTIVKEWLAQLLSPDEDVCRSPRSYNSQVGVPLSVWELTERHTLGVFEAGISEPGEMARLAAVIQPTLGLFTMLGTAHDAGFSSQREKLREKLRLFQAPGCERLFYCCDQDIVHEEITRLEIPTFSWSRRGLPADVQVQVDVPTAGPTPLRLRWVGQELEFLVPFNDEPSLENALHCLAFLLWRGVAPEEIQRRLSRLHPVAMRLEMKQARHDCYLLDDTYNNDLAGLALALDALSRQPRHGRRTVILSDVLESGLPAPVLYEKVSALLQAHGVSRLVAIGSEISRLNYELGTMNYEREQADVGQPRSQASMPDTQHRIPNTEHPTPNTEYQTPNTEYRIPNTEPPTPDTRQAKAWRYTATAEPQAPTVQHFPTTESFLAALGPDDFHHETILVKGARRFGFERIVAALQQQQHGTVLEVNLDALTHNLQYYRQRLAPGTRLMVMVKAFAYGSGSYEVASLLQFQRVDYLAVAYADEGVALRENGISLPIMVMNPAPDSFGQLRRYRLEPEIYSLERLHDYLRAAHDEPLPPLHLKLDTGMRRLGFEESELPDLTALLTEHRALLPVASLMTHLAAADEPRHDAFTEEQLAAFRRMAAVLEQAIGQPVVKHALNSAGILRFPEAQFDLVRLGIGLYGVDASGTEQSALRPVSSLRTTISQIKTLPAGSTVGYGRRGAASAHERRIATLAIGYADGYDRRFGNGVGEVLIHGQRAPLVGSVCMDMCMADVSHIDAARAGDAALIFGPGLDLSELAARIGTIPYELLTNVSERVKRVFVSE